MKPKLSDAFAQYRPSLIHDPAQFIARYHRVTYGLAAGMVASFLVHPLDLLKTRIQNSPTPYTYMEKGRWIIRNQGWRVMYTGVSAAMYRQLFNTGPRLFSYHTLYDHHIRTHKSRPTITQKVKIGLVSGLLGAFLGVPTEVVLVRMMAASAPSTVGRNEDVKQLIKNPYKSFWNGIRRVIAEEGVRALWRGGALTMIRSIVNTVSQIGTYAFFRDHFKKSKVAENYKLHVLTALCSSMVLTVLTLPIDVVKTRYQVRKSGVTQKEIFLNIVRTRGLLFFWTKPFLPYYTRLTLHTLTSFFVIETIENTFKEQEDIYVAEQNKKKTAMADNENREREISSSEMGTKDKP